LARAGWSASLLLVVSLVLLALGSPECSSPATMGLY
jgi:hypothetical protein